MIYLLVFILGMIYGVSFCVLNSKGLNNPVIGAALLAFFIVVSLLFAVILFGENGPNNSLDTKYTIYMSYIIITLFMIAPSVTKTISNIIKN